MSCLTETVLPTDRTLEIIPVRSDGWLLIHNFSNEGYIVYTISSKDSRIQISLSRFWLRGSATFSQNFIRGNGQKLFHHILWGENLGKVVTHWRGCNGCEALRFVLLKIVQHIVSLVQVTVGRKQDWRLRRCRALSELFLKQISPIFPCLQNMWEVKQD